MKLLLALLLTLPLLAQQATLTMTGPATARPGQAVNVSVGHNVPNAVGLQWTAEFPSGWSATGVTAGTAATAAQKSVGCSANWALCLIWGMNTTVIAPGQVASIALLVPVGTAPGQAQISLSGSLAVNASAASLAVSAGPALSILVLAREDLNGDGSVNVADVTLAVDQARGAAACAVGDLNADSKCNLVDVYIVVVKALGI